MLRRSMAKAELLMIVLFAIIPLFIRLPYRVNIFLSWEGAYRISEGQLPFRDFGTPLGGMYWVIPAIFFKVFGAKMITLIKAQVLLNIIGGLSFLSILKSLGVRKEVRLASVLLFCISYSFFNFWPWYNHSVIVYELAGLACLCRYMAFSWDGGTGTTGRRYRVAWLTASAFLMVCSLLTKQDAGGMAFILAGALLAAYCLQQRTVRPLLIFCISYAVILSLFILPFLRTGFGYWFNHGQPPHSARVSPFDIADEFFGASAWLKFYLFLIVVLALARYRVRAVFLQDRKMVILLLLTLGVLAEAAVFQVTSYTPPDNNIFFHSLAFPCILTLMAPWLGGGDGRPGGTGRPGSFWVGGRGFALILCVGVMLWWSGNWWKYTRRLIGRVLPRQEKIFSSGGRLVSPTGENVVNKDTYMIPLDSNREVPMDQWVECGLPSFDRIYMPPPTAAGIHRLMQMDLVRNGNGQLRVLNMSELTPLAREFPYRLERNPELPLWYHLGVGMFNRQADTLEARIRDHYYDLVLFEYIPGLNNFYPFRVRDVLKRFYRQTDVFMAPRRGAGETLGNIEVYVPLDK
jgi:hypothetical protein